MKKINILYKLIILSLPMQLYANPLVNGQYLGLSYNYSWNKTNLDISPSGTTPSSIYNSNNIPHTTSWNNYGSAAGIVLGFNRPMPNNVIWGAVIDYQQADIKGSETIQTAGTNSYFFQAHTKLDLFSTIRLNLGTIATENTYIGITGGLAIGRLHQTANFTESQNGVLINSWAFDNKTTQPGWCLGVNSQYSLSNNFSLGLQYLYYQFASNNVAANGTTPATSGNFNYSFEDQGQVITLSINYYF